MTLVYVYIRRRKLRKTTIKWKKSLLRFRKKNFCIPKLFLNNDLFIHQGKKYVKRFVYQFMIGRKAGEFCLSKKPFFYPPKKKKKR